MAVGIIIPAYNGKEVIAHAIDSILAQTYTNWELIIVDDGSTDGTREVVERYLKQDARIRYLYQENSGGPAKPLNNGMRLLETEYVALLEQDDWWLPEKLERQIDFLEKSPELVGVGSEAYVTYGRSSSLHRMRITPHVHKEWLRVFLEGKGVFYNLSTLLFRKKDVLFDEQFVVAADVDFYITLIQKGFDIVHEPLSVYSSDFSSLSKGEQFLDKLVSDEKLLLKKHASLYERFPKAHAKHLGFIATSLFSSGRQQEVWKYIKKSLEISWFQPLVYVKVIIMTTLGKRGYLSVRNWYFKYIKKR